MTHQILSRRTAYLTVLVVAMVTVSSIAVQAAPAGAGEQPSLGTRGLPLQPPGSLVLVGSSLENDRQAIRDIIDLAGGQGLARIGIVTAAEPPPASAEEAADDTLVNSVTEGRRYAALFEKFGAVATYPIPLDTSASVEWVGDDYGADRVDDPGVLARLNHLTGFFFADGDLGNYAGVLQACTQNVCGDQPALAAIRQRLAAGAVVAGSAAGATILQGTPLVMSGESWDGWANGVQDDDEPFTPGMVVREEGGFGFLDIGALDVSASALGRQGRLVRTAMYADQNYAFGIDDGSALVVTQVGTTQPGISVVGEGGVHVFNLTQATFTPQRIRGVRWSWLRGGDGFNLKAGTVIKRVSRESVPRPRQTPDLSVNDVWSVRSSAAGRMTQLGVDLVRSGKATARGVTLQPTPRFEVLLTDDGHGRIWQSKHGDKRRAFANLLLSIQREV